MKETRPREETYSKSLDLNLWRNLFRYTLGYKKHLAWLAVFAVGTAGVDTLLPLLTRRVIDDVTNVAKGGSLATPLWTYALAYLVLTIALSACIFSFIWFGGKIRTHVSHDIRRDGFSNLQDLSFSFHDARPVGWLMARMTSDCERLSMILAWGVLDFVWGITLMTSIAVVMFVLDWKLALGVLAVIPLLAWVSVLFKKRILKWSRVVRKTNSRITASYNEAIMGVRTSKAFVQEQANLDEFGGLTSEMYGASVKNALYTALYLPLVLTLGSVATGVALAMGGFDVTAGRISIGTLIAFLVYTRHFFDPIGEIAHWFAEMQMAQASAERILGLINADPEIRDSDAVRARLAETGTDGHADHIGDISMVDVSFSYRADQPVLKNFSLEVKKGQTIALVGSTGGGKSTIVNLLCRFYEPNTGEIRIDGVEYRQRSLDWLQSNLGIVLQTPHLFGGSIKENIRYGKLEATDDEIRAAAKLAGADDFIKKTEKGYDTEVGESGNRLSTGQKQLISFARAVLARPKILVMDEATSSVDTETEQRIQQGLNQVLSGRTSFVIAHRLSTIRAADRILVIEKGEIAEQGSHKELMSQRGRYYDLYTQQRLREGLRTSWAS